MKIFILILGIISISFAQKSKNAAVLLEAEAASGQNTRIVISWEPDEYAYEYEILRKRQGEEYFQVLQAGIDASENSYVDQNVEEGVLYEYQVRSKSDNGNGFRWRAFGYITASVNYQTDFYNGKVLILIDSTVAEPLAEEIKRLEMDLAKEGWGIATQLVSRAEGYDASKVMATKQIILDEYARDQTLTSVLLLGRVAVPYSGGYTNSVASPPDGHGEGAGNHTGAWPADLFYGELDYNWLDQSVNVTTSNREVNKNIPGDGKFDHIFIPDNIDLSVGRIDFYDLPAFEETEIELLRRYLDKNHAFRNGDWTIEKKGLIDEDRFQFNNLGYREAFSSSGWRNFVPLVGNDNVKSAEWSEEIFNNNYLWAYGCGAGSFTSSSGVVNTNQLASNEQNAVFTFLFGSYFGDWDSRNNLMRSALASEGNILTCGWAARPHWYVHSMGSGEPIGRSLLKTQNNINEFNVINNTGYYGLAVIEADWLSSGGQKVIVEEGYALGFSNRNIHTALMGDPTLTMDSQRNLPKANSLTAIKNEDGTITLNWDGGPTDELKEWDIYRASWFQGPYEKLNENIVNQENFTDENPLMGEKNIYLVKRRHYINDQSGIRFAYSQGEIVAINQDGVLSIDENKYNLTVGPNPTRNKLSINFELKRSSPVQVIVYDASGNSIKNWDFAMLGSGENKINWDFRNKLQTGIYFVKFISNNSSVSQKFMVIK